MVGLFINTLPVAAAPDPALPVGRLARAAPGPNLALREHEHTPLARDPALDGLERARRCFDTILVFENYPLDEALRRAAAGGLAVLGRGARTSSPATRSCSRCMPAERLDLHYRYDRARLGDAADRPDRPPSALPARRPGGGRGPPAGGGADAGGGGAAGGPRGRRGRPQSLPGRAPAARLFERQVRRDPLAVAAIGEGREVGYAALERPRQPPGPPAAGGGDRPRRSGGGGDGALAGPAGGAAGGAEGGRRLPAARPGLPGRAAGLDARGQRRPPAADREPPAGDAAARAPRPGASTGRRRRSPPVPTTTCRRLHAAAPGLRDLHLGLDRPAQGRGGAAGGAGQPPGQHGPGARHRGGRALPRPHLALLRHRRARALPAADHRRHGGAGRPARGTRPGAACGRRSSAMASPPSRRHPRPGGCWPTTTAWPALAGRRVLCGGEALPADLAARLLGAAGEVWNLYGPTETTIWSAVARLDARAAAAASGVPIANTRLLHPGPGPGAGAAGRRRRALYRRRRPGARLSRPAGPDRRALRARPVRAAGRAPLPHGRPRAPPRRRHARVSSAGSTTR